MHACTIQRASEHFSKTNQPVLAIDQQQSKDFLLVVLHQCLQVDEYLLRYEQFDKGSADVKRADFGLSERP